MRIWPVLGFQAVPSAYDEYNEYDEPDAESQSGQLEIALLRCGPREFSLRLVRVVSQKQSHQNDKCVVDAPKNTG